MVNVRGLEDYARTPEAQAVPQNKHGQSYSNTGAQLVKRLLLRVKRPTPASGVGYVEVRYWNGKLGSALVDAGLVGASREQPVPEDWSADPFSLPKSIRGIALGNFDDFDDFDEIFNRMPY